MTLLIKSDYVTPWPGSTSLVASAATGEVAARQRYLPFGGVRWRTPTPLPTDRQYTDQRWDETLGLYDYKARYYDPTLARFIQPDTIVPEPGNPQALNRYSYVLNNPLRYNDPSGHFSEEQLTQWFGKNWRSLFSHDWQAVLWSAELGDAVVYGGTTVVFAEHDGNLVGWNVDTRRAQSILDIANGVKDAPINLYRPYGANLKGGPSPGSLFRLGELTTSPELASCNRTNVLRWIYGDDATHAALVLPLDWYAGLTEHVEVRGHFAGWNLGLGDIITTGVETASIMWAVKQAAKQGAKRAALAGAERMGGPLGLFLLAVDIASWTTWDTSYTLVSGSGIPPVQPIPTPPSQTPSP